MTCALASNARFLARADSPVLPFLAPRVFAAAAPFPSNSLRDNASAQQEKEKKTSREPVNHPRSPNEHRAHWSGSCSRVDHGRNACLLSRNTRSSVSNVYNLRYADISSFARRQLRRYATEPESKIRKVSSSPARVRRLQKRRVQQSPASAKDTVGRKMKDVGGKRTQVSSLHLTNLRRKRALAITHKRLDTLLSFEPNVDAAMLMLKGRYRSLRRRIYSLARQKENVLDMRHVDGELRSRRILIRALVVLDRRVYPGARRSTHPIQIRHDPRCEKWCAKLFEDAGTDGESSIQRKWKNFDQNLRDKSWDLILLYLLDRRPDRALQFLRVLAFDSSVKLLDPAILADVLEHLARQCIKGEMKVAHTKATLVPTFYHIFCRHLANHSAICTQDLLMNIARLANLEDLERLFDILDEKKAYLGYDTLLHYANRFSHLGQHRYALRCMKKIVRNVSASNSRATVAQTLVARERFRWSCALVLRKSVSDGQNYQRTTEIVAEFLKLGVKLDILLYNVIMHNAMEAGDYATAFQVYNLLEENGLKPDEKTYSILLHGCTVTDNPATFHDFAEHCAKMAKEMRDAWLASDYLYYLYIRHCKEENDPERSLSVLSHAYSQFFSSGPLQWLRTKDSPALQYLMEAGQSDVGFRLLEPPPAVIYMMLQLEIKKAMAVSNTRVWNLYLQFRRIVREGQHPVITKLAENPIIWNAFLLGFCQKQQFANASQLIKNMTDHSPQPNVYSWNIFMQAFSKTDQVQAAERVYEIMRSRSVEPDQYTFGVLLRGYAKAQHVEKVGDVMEHIDNEQQLDPVLLQALARVTNRKLLMSELERSRVRKEKKAAETVQAEAEETRRRWEMPQFESLLPRQPTKVDTAVEGQSPQFKSLASSGRAPGFRSMFP